MNSIDESLKGRTVVVREHSVTGTTSAVSTRLFRCESGPGCDPSTAGVTIRGHFVSNPSVVGGGVAIDGAEDIERLASETELALAAY